MASHNRATRRALSRATTGLLAGLGTLTGAVVGYVHSVSSAIAATTVLLAVPTRLDARGFLVTVSGVNTANTVFALFAFVALGAPRTAVLVAVERTGRSVALGVCLPAVALAACVGALLVPVVGDRYLTVVGRLDDRRVSAGTLALLGAVAYLFGGWIGVVTLGVATLLGLVPPRGRARRVHLMGILVGLLALGP